MYLIKLLGHKMTKLKYFHFKLIEIIQDRIIGTDRPAFSVICCILGAVITSTPSELKFEATMSCLQSLGKVYFRRNCLKINISHEN